MVEEVPFHILEDILANILARLPTEIVFRFKCVSRRWNHLISNPNFLKRISSRQMILLPATPLCSIDYNALVNDTPHSIVKLCCPSTKLNDNVVMIVGSFNGIVFLVVASSDMFLYNPLTKASKRVLDSPWGGLLEYCDYAYGFGYRSHPDDLKIVRFKDYGDRNLITFDAFCVVSNSWGPPQSSIGHFSLEVGAGTFANGFLYWLGDHYDDMIVVALNVEEMGFSLIELPLECESHPSTALGTMDGCLYMICPKYYDTEIKVWVMREHRWSFVLSLNKDFLNTYINSINYICILDDRKIVMMNGSEQAFIYDVLKDSFKKLDVLTSTGDLSWGFDVTSLGDIWWTIRGIQYVETLVSPRDLCYV